MLVTASQMIIDFFKIKICHTRWGGYRPIMCMGQLDGNPVIDTRCQLRSDASRNGAAAIKQGYLTSRAFTDTTLQESAPAVSARSVPGALAEGTGGMPGPAGLSLPLVSSGLRGQGDWPRSWASTGATVSTCGRGRRTGRGPSPGSDTRGCGQLCQGKGRGTQPGL